MESLKLKNDKYWDTSGVFDHQELKTQEEINAIFKNEFNEVVVGASIGPISIATFDASAADMPLKGLTVNIEPVQSGSGDPSPDNVRPITGWTGCTVLYPGLDITRDLAIVRNKYINTSGVETDATTDFSHTDYFSVTPGETLYFSSYWDELPSSAQSIVFYDVNKVFKTRKWLLSSENQNKGHIGYNFKAQTVADGCYYAILNFNYDLRDRMVLTDKDPTISFPSPDPGTVYGGTLDVVNGKLTVDRASVDLGTLTWEKTSGGFFQTQKSRIGAKTGTTAPLLCSCYPYRSTGRDKFIAQTSSNICIVDSTYADLETFVSAITGQTMVYPLASPVPYDLTAEQITTLLGTNNIWADCGDVAVTYGAYLETVKAYADQVAEVAPFYAEYFVTTKEEIEAAINNKRQIFLRPNRYNSQFAQFAGSFWYIESPASFGVGSSGTGYRFITTIGESQTVFELKSSWSYRNYDLSAPADRAEAAADQAEAALANIPADYTELVNDVDNLKSAFNDNLVPLSWAPAITKKSYIRFSDGTTANNSSGVYARTTSLKNISGVYKAVVVNNPSYEYAIALYDETGALDGTGYLGHTEYSTGLQYITKTASVIGVSFRRVDQTALTDNDITAITEALSALAATDTTLSIAGAPADAKATGGLKNAMNGDGDIDAWERNIAINVGANQGLTYNGVTIECYNIGFKLSGTSTSAIAFPLNMPGGMTGAYSGYTASFKADRVCKSEIVPGHRYQIVRKLIKGTVTKGTNVYTPDNFPDSSGAHLVNVALFPETNESGQLTSPSSGIIDASPTGIFCVYIYSGVTFSDDATFLAYCLDLDADNAKTGALPSYWNEEINTSVASINNNIMSNDVNSVSLAFITDCHWRANAQHSPAVMKEILDRCNIRYFVNGGDILEASTTKVKAIEEITDIIAAFKVCRLPMYTLYGNHDRNRYASDSNQYLTLEEHWNLVFKSFDSNEITWVDTYKAFYWEDTTHRYVCIYWWNSADRVESFVSTVCNTDKKIILITHGLYFHLDADPNEDTMDSAWIINNFEPYKDKIRCIIQGHSHRDALRYAWETVPVIILDCDKLDNGAVEGTITEQSMSVLTIGDSTINVVKIGRGTDFNVTSGTPIFGGI